MTELRSASDKRPSPAHDEARVGHVQWRAFSVATRVLALVLGLALVAGLIAYVGELPAREPARRVAVIEAANLPSEARDTVVLIKKGGPFPYRKDGTVFGNFEKRLPPHERGYYREYTVPTPGSRDRGARRIVTGKAGEIYYTDDHYESFKRVRD